MPILLRMKVSGWMGAWSAAAAFAALLIVPGLSVATPIPGSVERDLTFDSTVMGPVVFWQVPRTPTLCPPGSQAGHPFGVEPRVFPGSGAYDVESGRVPSWSAQAPGFVLFAVDKDGTALASRVTCDMPYGASDIGWLNVGANDFALYRRYGYNEPRDVSGDKIAGGEVMNVNSDGQATRLERATGRRLELNIGWSSRPALGSSIARSASGDLVWTTGDTCTRRGEIHRWSGAANTHSATAVRRQRSAYRARLSGREVLGGCRSWLDPDSGKLRPILGPLDPWPSADARGPQFSAGPWIAATVSPVSSTCCDLVLDTRTAEWRKLPPSRKREDEIIGLTRSHVVWQTEDSKGNPVGPLQERTLASLPKAVDLRSARKRGDALRFRFETYRTPGQPEVLVYRSGRWREALDQDAVAGGIDVADIPGKHWYRVWVGDFYSRKVRL